MDKIVTENLFLLEFLVDNVFIEPGACQGDVTADTCVSVQFLDNAPLDICEDDFTPKRQYTKDSGNVKSGKSCLFSLTPAQAEQAVFQFDVYVGLFKKLPPDMDKVQIGNSLISIVNLFKELVSAISSSNNEQCPAAKTLKDTFKVTNATGQSIGEIGMYIRMSCFGKLIVTQFQMNLEDKSVLFKDKEGHSLYRYKKADSKKPEFVKPDYKRDSKEIEMKKELNSECPAVPCPRPTAQTSISRTPCIECDTEASQQQNPPGCYQEIGAQMGGNALTIRVHKDNHKFEQADVDDCSCTPGTFSATNKTQPRAIGGGGGCGCDPSEQQNFSMRPPCADSGVSNDPITFKMGGCGLGAQNNVTVVPPVCTAPDGTQYTELSDPNKDVFILRIGKKSEGLHKKNNLELELCTPKGPDTKPPPKTETRDTQWADEDALAAGGGGGGAKKAGKKGKGKK